MQHLEQPQVRLDLEELLQHQPELPPQVEVVVQQVALELLLAAQVVLVGLVLAVPVRLVQVVQEPQ